jgi:3-hydroxyisobutyrate dehydrogenase-like beta-hydroxyacid dehydrogenase
MISILGTGNMGSALVRALRDHGTPLTLWNRTAEKARAWVGPGVELAASPGAALAASSCSILNLIDYSVCQQILESDAAELKGKTLVQLSTGKPSEARQLASFAERHGADYLDGAIMGMPSHVGTQENRILYGGSRSALAEYRPVLEQLGQMLDLGEDPGAASALDFGCLMPILAGVVGLMQGAKACDREGIPPDRYDDFVRSELPLILDHTLQRVREPGFAEDPTQAEASIELMASLARMFSEYCREIDLEPALFTALTEMFEGGVAAGLGSHDWVNSGGLRVTPAEES